jgi:hypothetical protein
MGLGAYCCISSVQMSRKSGTIGNKRLLFDAVMSNGTVQIRMCASNYAVWRRNHAAALHDACLVMKQRQQCL